LTLRAEEKEVDINDYTSANREAWDQVMPLHQKKNKDYLDSFFSVPGAIIQTDPELLSVFEKIDFNKKNVIHLCCNNGIELMSIKNMGADYCVGVDISEVVIKEAIERKELCKIDCDFICSDVFDMPAKLENQFDVVMLTAGCLGWIPNLDLFFNICAKLLRKNGVILIHEIHPFSEMLPFDYIDVDDRLKIIEPYFRNEPIIENEGLDYVGKTTYESKTTYWFVHSIGTIVNSLYGNGIYMTKLLESTKDISAGHSKIEELNAGIPLSMIMIGKKI
jgi:SAM-dependent methyltransferase